MPTYVVRPSVCLSVVTLMYAGLVDERKAPAVELTSLENYDYMDMYSENIDLFPVRSVTSQTTDVVYQRAEHIAHMTDSLTVSNGHSSLPSSSTMLRLAT